MTGGTASTVSRKLFPTSQSRPIATQNSRMALPAAAFALRLLAHGVGRSASPATPPVAFPGDIALGRICTGRRSPFQPRPAIEPSRFKRRRDARTQQDVGSILGLVICSSAGSLVPAQVG